MMRDYLRSSDFDAAKMQELFALCQAMKARTKRRQYLDVLKGYTAALVFQKPSLRTRVTFDIGFRQLGGEALYLAPTEISLGARESVHDVAKNLERWVDMVIARVFAQAHIDELARAGGVPVVNALSDDEHPCQAMADYFTLYEHGLSGKDVRLAYVGDANNVSNSLMIAGALLGMDIRICGPAAYGPSKAVVEETRRLNAVSGGKLLVTSDVREALHGANAIYTDVWASMGRESEAAERKQAFAAYQVNRELVSHAEKGAYILHCLPAHRGDEITDEIVDSPESVVFDQAENRLHVQKAIMLECFGLSETVARQFEAEDAAVAPAR